METPRRDFPGIALGFERRPMFITGILNIRDVTPFARTSESAESSPEGETDTRRNGLKTY